MPPHVYTRRDILALFGATLGTIIACGKPPREETLESPAIEAMRRAALSPGPARLRLPRADRLPGRPIYRMPFALDDVPGFSRDTHYVHYERHYLEYYCRWVESESRLLYLAAAFPNVPKSERRTHLDLLFRESRALRVAANMVVLHEAYWNCLWSGTVAHAARDTNGIARHLAHARRTPHPTWMVVDGEGRLWQLEAENAIPDGLDPVAAIDCAEQAWALDFPTREEYLAQVFQNMEDSAVAAFQSAVSAPAFQPVRIPSTDPEAVIESLCSAHAINEVEPVVAGFRAIVAAGAWIGFPGRIKTGHPSLQICPPEFPSGLWGHQLL